MKKTKFYFFFLFILFFTKVASACNLKFSNFGSTPESLKLVENNNFPSFPNQFGGSIQIITKNIIGN